MGKTKFNRFKGVRRRRKSRIASVFNVLDDQLATVMASIPTPSTSTHEDKDRSTTSKKKLAFFDLELESMIETQNKQKYERANGTVSPNEPFDLNLRIVFAFMGLWIESGQQILISLGLAISHTSQYSKYPSSNVTLLHVYAAFQILYFVSVLFGLLAVVSQGRHFRNALLCWISLSLVVSIIQIIYLFYVIAYFNKRTLSLIAVTLVLFFVPKNSAFAFVVYKYYRLLIQGFYSPDYDELDYTKETFRRSRAGSSRRDSLRTLKEGSTIANEVPSKPDPEARNSRRVSTSNVLKVIPELSESRDSSLESKESTVSAQCNSTGAVESP